MSEFQTASREPPLERGERGSAVSALAPLRGRKGLPCRSRGQSRDPLRVPDQHLLPPSSNPRQTALLRTDRGWAGRLANESVLSQPRTQLGLCPTASESQTQRDRLEARWYNSVVYHSLLIIFCENVGPIGFPQHFSSAGLGVRSPEKSSVPHSRFRERLRTCVPCRLPTTTSSARPHWPIYLPALISFPFNTVLPLSSWFPPSLYLPSSPHHSCVAPTSAFPAPSSRDRLSSFLAFQQPTSHSTRLKALLVYSAEWPQLSLAKWDSQGFS